MKMYQIGITVIITIILILFFVLSLGQPEEVTIYSEDQIMMAEGIFREDQELIIEDYYIPYEGSLKAYKVGFTGQQFESPIQLSIDISWSNNQIHIYEFNEEGEVVQRIAWGEGSDDVITFEIDQAGIFGFEFNAM